MISICSNILFENCTNFCMFCNIPAAPCRSMLLSTFSHYSFFHIFANMYVLNSFCNGICTALGKEQTLALYLSAGVVASFASYIHKVSAGISGASLGAVSREFLLIDSQHLLTYLSPSSQVQFWVF